MTMKEWDLLPVDIPQGEMPNAFYNRDWTFIYSQSTGVLGIGVESHDDGGIFTAIAVLAVGYSGAGEHTNQPQSQHLVGKGPIPRGVWFISEVQTRSDTGPVSVKLLPEDGRKVPGGRSGFFIHGDNKYQNQSASRGCPIFPRYIREFLGNYRGRQLVVIE